MDRKIVLENMINVRDMGGLKTRDGRSIKKGLLIRGGTLFGASESDLNFMKEHVSLIVDFRTEQEFEEKPDPQLDGVQWFRYPTLREQAIGISHEKGTTAQCLQEVMNGLLHQPEAAIEHMVRMYVDMVTDEWALTGYGLFMQHLLREEENLKATFWHCTMGKDRAGIASLIVLEALGVDRETIIEDYLMTNDCAQDNLSKQITGTAQEDTSDPVARRSLEILLLAQRIFVERLYETVDRVYGGFEGFLETGLHFTKADVEKLKNRYLEE